MTFGRRHKAKPNEDGFFETALSAAKVTAGEMKVVRVAGRKVLVTRVGGRLYAFSDVCPHAAADLGKGRLFDGQIKCPDHGYTFDIRTGRATWPADEGCRLIRFTAHEEAGIVWIRLEPPAA
jgi:nitrite reductase/ring-hydroxylating ferredoxin subunit